ncbi:hypothetical protein CRE_23080 [Caenorhabditis remanei]|uniref:F-box domain-containing protein n=1 Tax=Caenorhabditis remanei TaxID=31234 RepID=E3N9E4_CAERE|nr:hypothetical protein CRE_23080 [Caenorhabditis remanei]
MEHTFPLFRLPENAIVHVLQNMDLNQLLIISLVSMKTKNLVSSLGLEPSHVDICIESGISLSMFIGKPHLAVDFYNDSNDQNELLPTDITLPVAAYVGYKGPPIQSSTPFNFSKWLYHIKTIFCCTQPPNFQFAEGWEKFGIESLKEAIGSVNILIPHHLLTNDSSRRVLKHFNSPSGLFLVKNSFEEACQIQQIFIQNCELIEFGDVHSLDDMLLINIQNVYFYHPISQKEFNRFLKHWICGSNPRLQHMTVSINKTGSVDEEAHFKGIKCMKVSKETKNKIGRMHGLSTHDDMIQIRRNDGTTAFIGTQKSENSLRVRFIVLH